MSDYYSAPYSPLVELTAGERTVIPWAKGDTHPGGPLFSLDEGRALLEAEFSVSGIPKDPEFRNWTIYIERVRVRDGVEDVTHKLDYSPPQRGSYKGIGWNDNVTWIEAGETWFFRAKLEADKGFTLKLRPIACKGLLLVDFVADRIKTVRK